MNGSDSMSPTVPPDFRQHDVDIPRRNLFDLLADRVGHMRNHLDRLAQIVATPLLGQDALVDAAAGGVVGPCQNSVREPFVVAEIKVGFRPVVGDEHLAVLERAHGARIDVEVGVELLQRDPQAAALEQVRDGR